MLRVMIPEEVTMPDTLDPEIMTALNDPQVGAVLADLLRRELLMPVSELTEGVNRILSGYVAKSRLEPYGRDEESGEMLYRLNAA
jgi:hypothetical protein